VEDAPDDSGGVMDSGPFFKNFPCKDLIYIYKKNSFGGEVKKA
jgi:hypothetical protein